jgi:glycosyltransferase involved in cell wall biosynthesis
MEKNIKLTIAIPTYNRIGYLSEILDIILNQCKRVINFENIIEILISDNASTDGTSEYIKFKKDTLNEKIINYYRNDFNMGSDLNFIECVKKAKGEYVWIFGDDDLLEDYVIENVMNKLANNNFSLIILSTLSYENKLGGKNTFLDYKTLVNYISDKNPHFILAHTLITMNIFLRHKFNIELAEKLANTSYSHMYAVVDNLIDDDHILITEEPIIKIREIRAPFAEPPKHLWLKQALYLHYVGSHYMNKNMKEYSLLFFNNMCKGTSKYLLLKQGLDLHYIGRYSMNKKLKTYFHMFFNVLPTRPARNRVIKPSLKSNEFSIISKKFLYIK